MPRSKQTGNRRRSSLSKGQDGKRKDPEVVEKWWNDVVEKYTALKEEKKGKLDSKDTQNIAEEWSELFDAGIEETGISALGELIDIDAEQEIFGEIIQHLVEGPKHGECTPEKGQTISDNCGYSWEASEIFFEKVWMGVFQNPTPYRCKLAQEATGPCRYGKSQDYPVHQDVAFLENSVKLLGKMRKNHDLFEEIGGILKDPIQNVIEQIASCRDDDDSEQPEEITKLFIEIFGIFQEGFDEEKSTHPDKNEETDTDQQKESSWETYLSAFLDNYYCWHQDLRKEIAEKYLGELFELAVNEDFKGSVCEAPGNTTCNCSMPEVNQSAFQFIFEGVGSFCPNLLAPFEGDLVKLLKHHPRIAYFSALVRMYPKRPFNADLFDEVARRHPVKNTVVRELFFDYLQKVTLSDSHRFNHVSYVEKLEAYLKPSEPRLNGQVLNLLRAIANENPPLFAGRGEKYLEIARNEPVEDTWFVINEILACRASICEKEADDVIDLLIAETNTIRAISYKQDVLEKLVMIAYFYPNAVKKRMDFVENQKKNVILRHQVQEVERAINRKADGSKSCTLV